MIRLARWMHSERYIGISFNPEKMKKWRASLVVQGETKDGGEHWTPEDAARAYDDLAALYLPPDAPRNFSLSQVKPEMEAPEVRVHATCPIPVRKG